MTFSPVNKIKAALLLVVMTLSPLAPAASFMTWWSTEENLKTAELLKDKAGNAPKLPFFQSGKKGMATGVTLASAALVVVLTTMVQAGVNGFVGDATTKDLPRSFGTKLKNALSAAFTPAQLKQVGLWSLVKSIKKDPTREDLATFGQRLGAWLKGNKTFLVLTVAEVAGACMLAKGEFDRHAAWKQHETDRNELLKLITQLELTKDATLAQLQEAAAEWNELKKAEARGVDAKTLAERRRQKEVLDGLSAEGARLLSLDFTTATVQEILAARAEEARLRPLAATFGGTATNTLAQLKEKQAAHKEKLSILQALFVDGFVSAATPMDELTRLEKMVQQVQTLTLEQMKPLHGNTIKKLLEIALQMKVKPESIAKLQRQALLKDLEDEKRRAEADAYVNPQPPRKKQKPTPHHELILSGREQLTFDLSHLGLTGPGGKITLVTLPTSEVGRMLNGSSTLNAQTQAILLGQLALQMQAAQTLSATSTALTVTSGFSFEQQTAILEALQHRLAELERQAVLAHKHQAAQSKWQDLGHSLLVKARSITGKKLRNWRTLGLKAQQILEQKAEILADADAYPAGAEVTIGGKTLWVVRNAGKAPSFSATPELPLSPVGEDDRHREGDRFSSVVDPTATPSIGGVRPLPGSATPKPTPQRHGGLGSPVPGLQFHTPGAVSTPGSVLKTPTTPFSADEEKTTVWVKLDKASGIKEIKGVKTVKTADELPERGWKNQVVIVPHESDPDNDCYRWSSSSRKWYKLNPNQWDFSEDFWSPAAQEDA